MNGDSNLKPSWWYVRPPQQLMAKIDGVFFLSRQYSKVSLNYRWIIHELKKKNKKIKIKVICQKVDNEINETLRDKQEYANTLSTIKKMTRQISGAWNYYLNLHKQMYYIAKSTVVIVDGYNIPISVLKHKKNTTIIQLWHALAAIKKFGYQSIGYKDGINPKMAKIMNMHKNYDYVISGSDEMKKYFAEAFNTPIEKVTSIGTPYIDYLLKNDNKVKNEIYKKHPELKNKKNIVYSPTFRRDKRDNIEEVVNNIDLDKYNLIVTYHDKDSSKTKNPKLIDCSDITYKSLIKIADYVITDYSALSVEAAIIDTKLLFYVYDVEQYEKENGLNVDLFKEFPEYTSTNIKDLVNVIEKDNYDMDVLRKFKQKYASNLQGTSTSLICDIILKNIKEKQPINLNEMENTYRKTEVTV